MWKSKVFFPFIPQHEKNEDGIKLRKSNRIRSHDYSSSPNGSMLYRIDLGEYFWFETGKNWGWMSTINKCQNRHQSTIIKCKNNQLVYRTFCFRQLIYAIRKTKWNPSNSCSCTAKKNYKKNNNSRSSGDGGGTKTKNIHHKTKTNWEKKENR